MVRILLVTGLLATVDARAQAELRVTSDRPVVVVVNAVPHPLGESGEVLVSLRQGREGLQNVRVRNLLGQEVWSGQLEVPRYMQVNARWEGRTLKVHETKRIGGPSKVPRWRNEGKDEGDLQRLAIEASDTRDAQLMEAELLLQQANRSEPTLAEAPPAEAPAAEAPPAGLPSKIKLINPSRSWSNVYIGEARHEFRGVEALEVELDSGTYPVRILDFQDKEVWAQGELWVYPDLVVELHFGKRAPTVARNKREAWHPSP